MEGQAAKGNNCGDRRVLPAGWVSRGPGGDSLPFSSLIQHNLAVMTLCTEILKSGLRLEQGERTRDWALGRGFCVIAIALFNTHVIETIVYRQNNIATIILITPFFSYGTIHMQNIIIMMLFCVLITIHMHNCSY